MAIDGIIFDSDGTLVDSETLSVDVILGILQEQGVVVSHEVVLERFRGTRFDEFAAALLADFAVLDINTFTEIFRERSTEAFGQSLKPMPGAIQLVKGLEIEKSIASNGPRTKLETCLGVTGLLPFFEDRIASAYEVGIWKPDPGLILHAADMMGLPAQNCLLVDDSIAGIEAGLAAGVTVVGYQLNHKMQQVLSQPVQVIDDLLALEGIIRAA